MKKRILFPIVACSAIIVGATSGILVKYYGTKVTVVDDYSKVDVRTLKPNCDAIVKEIDSYTGSEDKVKHFSTSKILNYSMEKFRRCENAYSFTIGSADVQTPLFSMEQYIRSATIKNGTDYFEESVSTSDTIRLASVANRMYQSTKSGDVNLHSASVFSIHIGDEVRAQYVTEPTVISPTKYVETYGKNLCDVFIYLICPKTILSADTEFLENGYKISISLDPKIGTYFYKMQMKNLSNLQELPSFEYSNLTFDLNKDLSIKHIAINEKYTAIKLNNAADTKAKLDMYFFSEQYLKIPALNEYLTYKRG